MEPLAARQYLRRGFLFIPFLCLLGASPLQARTFYVDGDSGDDTRTFAQAQDPATPWKTLDHADQEMDANDTIVVLGGTFPETLKVRHNGTTWIADPPCSRGVGATIDPPSDQAVVIDGKQGVTIEGFCIAGGTKGIDVKDANGTVVRNNEVSGTDFQCINFKDSGVTPIGWTVKGLKLERSG